jgi:hypothetical protein
MELEVSSSVIDTRTVEVVIVWTDGFDATESAKFKIGKLFDGFVFELVGDTNTITLTGPKKIVVTKEE